MKQYLDLLKDVLENGEKKADRTGTGTRSIFGAQLRFDLRDGFPLVTSKKIIFSSVVRELLWFIKGETNINNGLVPHTKIWNAWADENGDLGPVYGYQWRHWEKFEKTADGYQKTHVDQLQQLIHDIQHNPSSRRLIVSAWNVADVDRMALPPCHLLFQFNVANGFLDLQLYQRSADLALGVPFNIASYALLLMMVAQECDLKPRYFVHSFGDAHIYDNHIDGVEEQLTRELFPLPTVKIANKSVFDIEYDDIELLNYQSHDFIRFDVAV